MDNVIDIAKAISEFGVLIIIAAVVIYALIKLINFIFKWLDNKLGNKSHDELIEVRREISKQIQGDISEFLNKHSANRVHVVEFSNTVSSVAYLPFKYMNCTYEVYKLGKHSTASNIDKLPTSLFVEFFTAMYDNGHVILDIEEPDMTLGGTVYDLMAAESARHIVCTLMKTHRGKAIGYVAFERDDEFTKEDLADLTDLSDRIGALLSVSDK